MGVGKRQNNRKYPEANGLRPDNYSFRVKEAGERQAAYDALSTQEKIERLDQKFGKGVGAKKQRAKLELQLAQKSLHKSLNLPAEHIGADKPRLKAKDRRAQERNETLSKHP